MTEITITVPDDWRADLLRDNAASLVPAGYDISARLVRLVADALEAQEPLKLGVYLALLPANGSTPEFAYWDGNNWYDGAGAVFPHWSKTRAGFSVLEFIGEKKTS
jgi:hypothetical protein